MDYLLKEWFAMKHIKIAIIIGFFQVMDTKMEKIFS